MSEKSKFDILDGLLASIRIHPQIIEPGIGAEKLMEELNKACTKMSESNGSDVLKVELMANFINGIPQLFKPEIGVAAFAEDLLKAFAKYDEYFKDERKSG